MNINFADISQMFLQMVNPAEGKKINHLSHLSKDVSGKNIRGQSAFSTYLQKAAFSENIPAGYQNPEFSGMDLEKLEKMFSDYLTGETGQAFIDKLHQLFLQLTNGSVNTISLEPEGLGILAKLLEKAGFKKQYLTALMADLSTAETNKMEPKKISMDDIMKHLFDLPADALEDPGGTKEEVLFDTSAQPFVISLLQSFAIPEDTISTIMSEAERSGFSISLDQVIEHLKALEKKAVYTQTNFPVKTADNHIVSWLDSLGMKLPQNKTQEGSAIFLKDLTAIFQAYTDGQSETKDKAFDGYNNFIQEAAQWGKPTSRDLLASLFNHLENQAQTSKFSMATITQTGINQTEFVHDFSKNHFTGETGTHQKQAGASKLFLEAASLDPDMKSEQALKEIQALLSGKFSDGPDSRALSQKEATRLTKSLLSQSNDQNQVSGADVKTRESLGDLAFVKTKNSFKNLPTYVTHQVGKGLVRAINNGENSLKLQLKPPELGRLVIHIDNTGNTMKVSIMTENHAAREMLTANVNELRTVLSSAGISLESFDVDMNSNFRQSMADARNQSNSSGDKKQSKDNPVNAPVSDSEREGHAQDTALTMQNGSLHYVA